MKRDRIHDEDDEKRNNEDEQLRMDTTNEAIREASGDPDMDLNELKNEDSDHDTRSRTSYNSDITQGISYDPNDASGVRSSGVSDMDDQTTGGAGLNTGTRRGSGSNLTPKTGTTGSDYDGQNSTS